MRAQSKTAVRARARKKDQNSKTRGLHPGNQKRTSPSAEHQQSKPIADKYTGKRTKDCRGPWHARRARKTASAKIPPALANCGGVSAGPSRPSRLLLYLHLNADEVRPASGRLISMMEYARRAPEIPFRELTSNAERAVRHALNSVVMRGLQCILCKTRAR